MPSFDLDADLSDNRAYELLKNSPVTLFRRPEILDQMLGWLNEHNYQLIRLDASRWAAEADFTATSRRPSISRTTTART